MVSKTSKNFNMVYKSVELSKEKTKNSLIKIEICENKIKEMIEREEFLKEFKNNYQLSPFEKEVLTIGEMNQDFFSTLQKVNDIHSKCIINLKDQKIYLDVLDEMAIYQEMAYDRISRYIQNKTFSQEEVFEMALTALQERPILLDVCLKDIVKNRKEELIKRFYQAMSSNKGGIEISAHDPLKYVGDILGWIHQDSATEKELMENLGKKREAILNEIYEILCPNLKLRIEQVLEYSDDEIRFKLVDLLELYSMIFKKIIGNENEISNQLILIKNQMVEKFIFNLNISKIKFEVTSDLQPPSDLLEFNQIILKVKISQEYLRILDIVLNPILDNLKKAKNEKINEIIFKINCYLALKNLVDNQSNTFEKIHTDMNQLIENLIIKESENLLNDLGFLNIVLKIQKLSSKEKLIDFISQDEITNIIRSFYNLLFTNPSEVVLNSQLKITNSKIKNYIRARISNELLNHYEMIYEAILNEKNEYKNSNEIVFHSPKKIKILLEIN